MCIGGKAHPAMATSHRRVAHLSCSAIVSSIVAGLPLLFVSHAGMTASVSATVGGLVGRSLCLIKHMYMRRAALTKIHRYGELPVLNPGSVRSRILE